jgi:hypothetical protein
MEFRLARSRSDGRLSPGFSLHMPGDRQSEQPLPAHLVETKRLRSLCALMAQDIGGLHGNSQRIKIFSSRQEYGGKFDNFTF